MDVSHETVTTYQAFFRNLTDEKVEEFRELAAPHVRYRDPTMDARGIDAVVDALHGWFRDLDDIEFQLTDHALNGLVGFQQWIMRFRFRRFPKRLWELEGVSKITFNEEGKVVDQIDYWDSAPLYESVPVFGKVITLIKKLFA